MSAPGLDKLRTKLESMERTLQHGFPLSMEDQKRLVGAASCVLISIELHRHLEEQAEIIARKLLDLRVTLASDLALVVEPLKDEA